ncbi:MAG: MBL fold metallo-hydrolase [Gammaproteobacteria bacterium]|nr:MBL fold metallo-hydrolase [Gammaproteobacteria bacterium]
MTGELDVRQYGRVVRIPSPTGFSVGDINSYVILPPKGSDQLVLIDTGVGSQTAWNALQAGLGQFGYRIEDIRLLLLTHGHTDHFGQATRIREASGCVIWGHEAINMTVSRYLPSPDREAEERAFLRRFGITDALYDKAYAYRSYIANVYTPCEPDRLLVDGDRISVEDFELETIHTPGHCPEEVVYWQSESRQMFSGDHLLPRHHAGVPAAHSRDARRRVSMRSPSTTSRRTKYCRWTCARFIPATATCFAITASWSRATSCPPTAAC